MGIRLCPQSHQVIWGQLLRRPSPAQAFQDRDLWTGAPSEPIEALWKHELTLPGPQMELLGWWGWSFIGGIGPGAEKEEDGGHVPVVEGAVAGVTSQGSLCRGWLSASHLCGPGLPSLHSLR